MRKLFNVLRTKDYEEIKSIRNEYVSDSSIHIQQLQH